MLRSALLDKLISEKKIRQKDVTVKVKSSQQSAKKTPVKTPKVKSRRESTTNLATDEFDEEIRELGTKFRIDPDQVKQGVQGLIKFTTENPKLKNNLFDDEQFPVFLQINSLKVPKGLSRIARLPLKHSILSAESEVCLIVPDVKGIPNKQHEQHLDQYEKLLRQKGVDNIKTIMTFHEFRTEYETFELRNKLVELYDVFLVDGRISGKTVRKCGQIFYKKRKVPSPIKLRATKLKEHIDQTLRKTPLYLHTKGDSYNVQIGHSKMGLEELVENAFYVVKELEKEFPGGFGNVRSINLFAYRGLSIPIYTTLKNRNNVNVSINVKKPKPVETVTGELSTRLKSGVIVKSTGEVSVYQFKNKSAKKQSEENAKKDNETGSPKMKRKIADSNDKTKKKRKVLEGESSPQVIKQKKNFNKKGDKGKASKGTKKVKIF